MKAVAKYVTIVDGVSVVNMNLYEFKKSAIENLPPLSPEEYTETMEEVDEWIISQGNYCYILLSWEAHYITLFDINNDIAAENDNIIHCLQEAINCIGTIQAVEYGVDSLIFWINKELYIFAPYDKGVVYCHE